MDKKAKKQMVRAWRENQRADARALFPIAAGELRAMFDMLDIELPRHGCDHTRRLTKVWLESRGHDVAAVFAWLESTGGYCDCEVLANSEEAFTIACGGSG